MFALLHADWYNKHLVLIKTEFFAQMILCLVDTPKSNKAVFEILLRIILDSSFSSEESEAFRTRDSHSSIFEFVYILPGETRMMEGPDRRPHLALFPYLNLDVCVSVC